MARDAAEVEVMAKQLKEDGVRFSIAAYTDLHGNIKGKMVPIDHFVQMAGGSELFTGAALDGLPQDVSDEELSAHPDLDRGSSCPGVRTSPCSSPISTSEASRSRHRRETSWAGR